MGLFNFLSKKKAEEPIVEEPIKVSEWVEFKNQKPPHEVVLAACNTYDCGWVMDTAWWYEDKQCWMLTGNAKSKRGQLEYTHWRLLPPDPDGV
jgi:hypothetical protein